MYNTLFCFCFSYDDCCEDRGPLNPVSDRRGGRTLSLCRLYRGQLLGSAGDFLNNLPGKTERSKILTI